MSSAVLAYGEVAVAEVAGEIAGFAAFEGDMLSHLYVDPDHQRQGVGSALLDWAKETRPRGFTFWVFQRNEAARRFYERAGLPPRRAHRRRRKRGARAGRALRVVPYSSGSRRIEDESRALSRRIAFVWSCETRDSVTPSTSPISRSVSSS
jgi:Acetyltransferase (GNAT) domain